MLEKNAADTGRKTEKQPGERIGEKTMEKRTGRSSGMGSCGLEKQMKLKKDGKQACCKEQYLRVLELCLTLNNIPSGKDKTKGPVAFCDFMGHTSSFFVSVFLEGWRPDAKEEVACTYKNGEPIVGWELGRLIGFLEELAEQWA